MRYISKISCNLHKQQHQMPAGTDVGIWTDEANINIHENPFIFKRTTKYNVSTRQRSTTNIPFH